MSVSQNTQHHSLCEDLTKLNFFSVKQILTISLLIDMFIQGVPGGICQTSGESSLG